MDTDNAAESQALAQAIKRLQDEGLLKRPWTEILEDFLSEENNRRWFERHLETGPVYCLPAFLIKAFAAVRSGSIRGHAGSGRGKHLKRPGLLSADDARAEFAFTELCRRTNPDCVGFLDGKPLIHGVLGPASSSDAFSDEFIMSFTGSWITGTLEQRRRKLRIADETEVPRRDRRLILQRAGQLVCHRPFWASFRPIMAAWEALKIKPKFPLSRRLILDQELEKLPQQTEAFQNSLITFLDAWELLEIPSSQLVVPLGPQEVIPARTPLNGLGEICIFKVYPMYWPLSKKEGASVVARLGHGGVKKLPGVTTVLREELSLHERAYLMRLAEWSFRRRYGDKRGYVDRFIIAFSAQYGVGGARVRQIREAYKETL